VVDTEGRGPSADIFIVPPRVETGDAILEDVKPTGQTSTWWIGSSTGWSKGAKGTVHEALITLMDNRLTGETVAREEFPSP